ncbi:MAG: tetratricopeptide repeat protein [Kiritimatiellia bacterium]|nr:tetratricopeptide repeat protein [Kiritimatiellia bacterium]
MRQAERAGFWAVGVILVALGAYHNSFRGPFILDDNGSIRNNPTIERLWPIRLTHPELRGGDTVKGRPLVNTSLALNYALGGRRVAGYHGFNLVLHIGVALTLMGLVRRTCLLPGMPPVFRQAAAPLAGITAMLWAVHPLTTAAVTYLIQRAEALMALFYLLTLYASLRGAESRRSGPWYAAAVLFCLLGAASKEAIATAPLAVLLYDRAFLAGSFKAAFRKRWGLYAGLTACWIPLAWLVASTGLRGGTVGAGPADYSIGPYAWTQIWAIARYVRLAFWPDGLIFDYGRLLVGSFRELWLPTLGLVLGLAAAVVAWVRWPRAGFPLHLFFLVLAPSSSVIPVMTQTVAEHRMYLPLAGLLSATVLGLYRGWTLRAPNRRRWIPLTAAGLAVLALSARTVRRNEDYRTVERIWRSTLQYRPTSARAHTNLGIDLQDQGRSDEALASFQEALVREPDFMLAHYNLGITLGRMGRHEEAVVHFREAARIEPDHAPAYYNWGIALGHLGRHAEGIELFREAVRRQPDYAPARKVLETLQIRPGDADR